MRAVLAVATIILPSVVFLRLLQVDEDLRKEQVPAAVITAFESAHPGITPKEYETKTFQGKPVYEVEYEEGGKEYEVLYTPEGAWIRQPEGNDDD